MRVLLRNTKASEKLTRNFESTPYTVLTKEGNEVMVESKDGVAYRRDSSFVKPYHPPTDGTPTVDIALENQKLKLGTRRLWILDPPALSGFRTDSKTLSWTSQNEL